MEKFTQKSNIGFWNEYAKKIKDSPRGAHSDKYLVELEDKSKEIHALNDKIKIMGISKSVDVSNNDVKETRLKINEYIREVDKCLALLNN